MQKDCLNDPRRQLRTAVVSRIHSLDHVLSHPWYYRWIKQANLQDYPAGPPVVKGPAKSGLGDNLEQPQLVWVRYFGKTIICITEFSKWLALSITEPRKGSLHLQ